MASPGTIILIDDDIDHIDLQKLAFKQIIPEAHCISFIYPDDAIKIISSIALPPDYVFIDFNLPGKQGIECLYFLRNDSKYKETRIVICANEVQGVVQEALKEAGANFVFKKPPNLAGYRSMIRSMLSQEGESFVGHQVGNRTN